MASNKPVYRVAVLLFAGADILDFAGPLEILSHASYDHKSESSEPLFSVETVAAAKDESIVTGKRCLRVQATLTIAEALQQLESFHVLIVPGGPASVMQKLTSNPDGVELDLIHQFSGLSPFESPQGSCNRVLLSTCVGALLLGTLGLLAGLTVTTHHLALDRLRKICEEQNPKGSAKTVIIGGKRFVDGGLIKNGVKVVTSGGVSSGLDSTLFLVSLFLDQETADWVADLIEYERRQE